MENDEQAKEQQRVDQVVSKIDQKILTTKQEYDRAHSETKRVQRDYSDNTSVNYFEVDDRIETSAELQQQRGLVSRLTENESILKTQLSTLHDLKKNHPILVELISKTMMNRMKNNFTSGSPHLKTPMVNFSCMIGGHPFPVFTIMVL